jgi:DNA-binding transcriptional LysR family regulator
MDMELRRLRYFVAIAETGHLTRAAARLGLQQPPLTQQLRRLESEVGAPLFVRTPRGMTLTPAGIALLPEARAALAAAARGAEAAVRAARGLAGRLELGFATSAATHPLVPALIRRFAEEHPAVSLGVREANAAELTASLARGDIAVALLRVPVAMPKEFVAIELLHEPALAVLPAGHRLLGGWKPGEPGPPLRLRQLAGERFILVRRGSAPGLYANLLAACARAGFAPDATLEVDHMLTNVNLVAAGIGVSVVPASMRGFQAGQVAYCAILDKPPLEAPLTLLRRSDASPTALRFEAMAREAAATGADPAPTAGSPAATAGSRDHAPGATTKQAPRPRRRSQA